MPQHSSGALKYLAGGTSGGGHGEFPDVGMGLRGTDGNSRPHRPETRDHAAPLLWPNVVAKALAAHMAEFPPNTLTEGPLVRQRQIRYGSVGDDQSRKAYGPPASLLLTISTTYIDTTS